MKQYLSTLTATAFAFAFLFHSVQQHEKMTQLGHRWETDRPAVEARIRDNHTNDDDGSVNESAIKANTFHIEHQYVPCLRLNNCKAKNTTWNTTPVK